MKKGVSSPYGGMRALMFFLMVLSFAGCQAPIGQTSSPEVLTKATATAWAAGVSYKVGDVVSYGGTLYSCLQAHTSIVSWEPPNVLALWKPNGSSGPTPTPTPTPASTPSPTPVVTPTPVPTTGLNPHVAPGGNFDLSTWQLQLPIGSQGSPTTISPSQLQGANGFSDLYFYTDSSDGAMTFMDPTKGVTTSGSLHPRSEMREVTSGWATSGTNVMTVTEKVTQVPSTVCVGQIFQSPPAPSKPLMELQYSHDGTIKVLLENTNQGGSSTFTTVGSVPLGTKYTYSLSLTGSTIKVTVNGAVHTLAMPASFVGEKFYFKVGAYDQSATAGTPGTTPGTVVKVYSLKVTHQ